MGILFFMVGIYCFIQSVRRFAGKRPPFYIEKDPDITEEKLAEWNKCNGYSMLFWGCCSLMLSLSGIFGYLVFNILAGLAAAAGIWFALKGSNAIHTKRPGRKSAKAANGFDSKKKKNEKTSLETEPAAEEKKMNRQGEPRSAAGISKNASKKHNKRKK